MGRRGERGLEEGKVACWYRPPDVGEVARSGRGDTVECGKWFASIV